MTIPYAATDKPIIVIDPGHGGYDPGACAQGSQEKDIVLKIGLQLRDELTRAGFVVVMTRDTDKALGKNTSADLRERCHISNAAGAAIFLSLHVNAGGGRGAEIYVYGDGGPIRPLAQGIVENTATVMSYHGKPIRDGGPNGTSFAVICGTEADAMLLEIGFIDSDDRQKIFDNLDKFAPLICRAFCDFFGKPYPELEPVPKLTVSKKTAAAAIAPLKAMAELGDADAMPAFNYAANALRRAAGEPVNQDLGKPDQEAAGHLCNVLSGLWHLTDQKDIRTAYNLMAVALRRATGIK